MARLPLLMCCLALGSSALAEDTTTRRAREEVERTLDTMVHLPAGRIEIFFEPLDEGNYQLVEAEFTLDGKIVPSPSVSALRGEGTQQVYSGEITPGEHTLSSRVVYEDPASVMMSDEGGFKWKVGSEVTFTGLRGIAVKVRATPQLDRTAVDPKAKIKLTSKVVPEMIAPLDDGKMPEPLAVAPVLAAAEPQDPKKAAAEAARQLREQEAGERRAAKTQAAEEARLLREQKAEERKAAKAQAAEEARLLREQKAAEKAQQAEERRAARLAAQGEPAAKSTEVAAAPVESNEAKAGRLAEAVAKAQEEQKPAVVAEPAVGNTAGEVVQTGLNPGSAQAAAPVPEVPAAVTPPAETGSSFPVSLLVAVGAGLIAVAIFLDKRKRS
jgi:hypothetical protein